MSNIISNDINEGFPGGAVVKNLPAMWKTWVLSLGREDSLGREWQTSLVFLPENSTDRRAWWATVHGVAKNRTGLTNTRSMISWGQQCVQLTIRGSQGNFQGDSNCLYIDYDGEYTGEYGC